MWRRDVALTAGKQKSQVSASALNSTDRLFKILPCAVSQLLSAHQVSQSAFAIRGVELFQVSVVGIVGRFSRLENNIQFTVDDMTGPPIVVKQWSDSEEGCAMVRFDSPGTYAKVTGALRSSEGQRTLLALNSRALKDLNEITSHMLEVIQAHMCLSGKGLDVNMNHTLAPMSGTYGGGRPKCPTPKGPGPGVPSN